MTQPGHRTSIATRRLAKFGRYYTRELPSVGRWRQTSFALEQAPERGGVLVTNRMSDLFDADVTAFQELLCFLDADRMHIVHGLVSSCRSKTSACDSLDEIGVRSEDMCIPWNYREFRSNTPLDRWRQACGPPLAWFLRNILWEFPTGFFPDRARDFSTGPFLRVALHSSGGSLSAACPGR